MLLRRLAQRKINRLAFMVFVAAAGYALARALLPDNDNMGLIPWDKAKHFIVFYVLTGLAMVALPASRFWRIGVVLLTFGILIEVLQALPFIGRDASLGDILADACGISAMFGPILLRAWSTRTASDIGQVVGPEVEEPLKLQDVL